MTNATVPPIRAYANAEPPVSNRNEQLWSMTKPQLLEYAEEHGIAGLNRNMLKETIIATIEGALA